MGLPKPKTVESINAKRDKMMRGVGDIRLKRDEMRRAEAEKAEAKTAVNDGHSMVPARVPEQRNVDGDWIDPNNDAIFEGLDE